MPSSRANATLIETTTSLCPQCLRRVDADIVRVNGSVRLLKRCPQHGEQSALLEEDAAFYLAREAWNKPGTPSKTQTRIDRGCPFDCGLCPAHDQHTCIGLIEVTGECDLACADCYARARTGGGLDLEQIGRMMDFLQDAESGRAEVVQISGGEPARHPRILDILRLAKAKRFKYVMLNTNGLRIAEDEAFVRELAGLAGGFEVYLQFDGLDRDANRRLRGRDVTDAKLRALEQLARFEVPATLVATIEAGVNDHEIGRILDTALATPGVRGVNFQPLAFFGPVDPARAERRTTLTGILRRLEEQTAGRLRVDDFFPLPCDVHRVALTYLSRDGGLATPITRRVDLRKHLPLIRNTFAFDADDFVEAARGGGAAARFLAELAPLIPETYGACCLSSKVKLISRNTFRVSVSSFVDAWNFDLKSMQRECVHVVTPDLRRIPFSAYNMLHRGP